MTTHHTTTADDLVQAPPRFPRQALSKPQAALFRELKPHAIYAAGNYDGPEPRRWGDNQGAWPILLGTTGSWADNVTPQMNRYSPHRARGMVLRIWTLTDRNTLDLLAGIEGLIRDRVEQLHGSWIDIGHDADLALFEQECLDVARRRHIGAWDDVGLAAYLDQFDAARMAARLGLRRG